MVFNLILTGIKRVTDGTRVTLLTALCFSHLAPFCFSGDGHAGISSEAMRTLSTVKSMSPHHEQDQKGDSKWEGLFAAPSKSDAAAGLLPFSSTVVYKGWISDMSNTAFKHFDYLSYNDENIFSNSPSVPQICFL